MCWARRRDVSTCVRYNCTITRPNSERRWFTRDGMWDARTLTGVSNNVDVAAKTESRLPTGGKVL